MDSSRPETEDCKPTRITLCDDGHRAMKQHEATWNSSRFGGYQSLGSQLGEVRYCHVCQTTVVRLVSFTTALLDVLEHLSSPQQPSEDYVRSASLLTFWALKNLPPYLGVDEASSAPISQIHNVVQDWPQLGYQIRDARERAGLSRKELGQLSGLADSTIRNLETGRHRPNGFTLHRLGSVPAFAFLLHPSIKNAAIPAELTEQTPPSS